jgi:hypothetical protein
MKISKKIISLTTSLNFGISVLVWRSDITDVLYNMFPTRTDSHDGNKGAGAVPPAAGSSAPRWNKK